MTETPSMLQAIYGGTFDPIHYGHLKSVTALAEEVSLRQVIIMPNNVPPHRPQPQASSIQRKKNGRTGHYWQSVIYPRRP